MKKRISKEVKSRLPAKTGSTESFISHNDTHDMNDKKYHQSMGHDQTLRVYERHTSHRKVARDANREVARQKCDWRVACQAILSQICASRSRRKEEQVKNV